MDLSEEGEFADYDEKGDCPVGVTNLRALFRVVSLASWIMNCFLDSIILVIIKFELIPVWLVEYITLFYR